MSFDAVIASAVERSLLIIEIVAGMRICIGSLQDGDQVFQSDFILSTQNLT